MTDKEIIFCDISNPTGIEDGIIQHEPLEYQKVGAGFILRTRMEHPKEHIQKLKQKILENQEKAKKFDKILSGEPHSLLNKNIELEQKIKELKDDLQKIYAGDLLQEFEISIKQNKELRDLKFKLENTLQEAINRNEKLEKENQKLKEDAELDQDIDWGDDGQRYCPTHKKSYHLYCKECKLEIKQLRKEIQNLKSILDKTGGSN